MLARHQDPIAAIATAPGRGAVGIVRLSGPGARGIALELFRASSPSFVDFSPRRLHHGSLVDRQDRVLDEVLAACLEAGVAGLIALYGIYLIVPIFH